MTISERRRQAIIDVVKDLVPSPRLLSELVNKLDDIYIKEIEELLESLRMEKRKVRKGTTYELQTEDGFMGEINIIETEDEIYNEAVKEFNKKIDKLKGGK